jgi:hypothetical protein
MPLIAPHQTNSEETFRTLNSGDLAGFLERTPITALQWSIRAQNCFKRSECRTLADVARKTDQEWMKVRNLGRKTLEEIKEVMTAFIEQHRSAYDVEESAEARLSALNRELLELVGASDPSKISPSAWAHLVTELKTAGKGGEPIGEVAARIGVKWASKRYEERLSDFLFPELAALRGQHGLGKTKIRVIVQCAIEVWTEGREITRAATGTRAEALGGIEANLREQVIATAMESAFTIGGLSEREREIFFQRYGILDGQPRTLEMIGTVYGVTRERIRQIQEIGQKKLIRPLDLRRVLEDGLRNLQPHFFGRLNSEYEGFIVEQSQNELLGRIGGWEGLLVELFYESVDEWLNKRAERTQIGWVHGGVTLAGLENAKSKLAAYLQSCRIPVPIIAASRETALPELMVRLAALHGAGWLVGDFVAAQWLRAKEQRVLRVHVQTRASVSPLLKRKALVELFHPGMPEDSFSPTTFSREVGCFPQLLLSCGSEYVLRVTPPWELTQTDIQPTPPPSVFNARSEDEGSEGDREDNSLYDFGFRLLQTRKFWRMGDLMDEFVRTSQGRYAATSVGQLTVSHPRVQRFAPGLWGVKDTVLTEDDYQALLTDEDCERYIEARWAKADMTPFSMWNPDMELRWCRWAKEGRREDIFQSLLSIITPEQWSCPPPLREHWKKRQREGGRYRLARSPRKSLAQLPVVADELLIATGAVVGRGGTSWMDLNILHGRTIDSHRSAPFLSLLIALGAVEPAKHWQEYHPVKPGALSLFQELCKLWIQSPSSAGQPLLDFVRTKADLYLREDREFGWVSSVEFRSLLSVLGKTEILVDEREVPA